MGVGDIHGCIGCFPHLATAWGEWDGWAYPFLVANIAWVTKGVNTVKSLVGVRKREKLTKCMQFLFRGLKWFVEHTQGRSSENMRCFLTFLCDIGCKEWYPLACTCKNGWKLFICMWGLHQRQATAMLVIMDVHEPLNFLMIFKPCQIFCLSVCPEVYFS